MFWHNTDTKAELQRQQIPLSVYHGYKQLVESWFKQHLPQTAPDPVGLCWKKRFSTASCNSYESYLPTHGSIS